MKFKIPPWQHQLEAIKRAEKQPYFSLFFEMGAGKTSTAINILRAKINEAGSMLRTLIFAPPIVVPNWKKEWLAHSSVDPASVHLLTGSGTERLKSFTRHTEGLAPGIFITNYESLLMPKLFQAFCDWAPEAIVFDESHKLKNPAARRSKLARDLAQPPGADPGTRPLVYLLSGTPVLNSPLDLFQQYLCMDGGHTFGQNYFSFRARYFEDRNRHMPKHIRFPKWEVKTLEKDGFDGVAAINQAIQSTSMRVLKKDCLDLPDLVRVPVYVGMSKEQERIYNEMRDEFITFLEDGEAVTASLAITQALRLQQIASGFAKTVEGTEREIEETPKMVALKELLEEITPHSKVVVWAVFKENYRQIRKVCDELGTPWVEVTGDVSASDRDRAIDSFMGDPAVRVYIGHPGSGGIGVNLTVAPYSIFYSRNFSLEYDLQAEARNHRGGSEIHEKITRYDLICENTIDELVTKALAQKVNMGEKTVRSLSHYLKTGSEPDFLKREEKP